MTGRQCPDWARDWYGPLATADPDAPETLEQVNALRLDALLAEHWPQLHRFERSAPDADGPRQAMAGWLDYTSERLNDDTFPDDELPAHRLDMRRRLNDLIAQGNEVHWWRIQLLPEPLPLPAAPESLPPATIQRAVTLTHHLPGLLDRLVAHMPSSPDPDMLFALVASLDMGVTDRQLLAAFSDPGRRQCCWLARTPVLEYQWAVRPAGTTLDTRHHWLCLVMPVATCRAAEQLPAATPPDGTPATRLRRVVRDYGHHQPGDAELLSTQLQDWRQTVGFAHRLLNVPLLSAVLAGQHSGYGLDRHSLYRLLTGQPNPPASVPVTNRQRLASIPDTAVEAGEALRDLRRVLAQPRRARKPMKARDLIAHLDDWLAEQPAGTVLEALGWWQQRHFQHRRSGERVRSGVSTAFKDVVHVLKQAGIPLTEPVAETTFEQLDDYLDDDALPYTTHRRAALRRHVYAFHATLAPDLGLPTPDYQPGPGGEPPAAPYLITPQDYARAKAACDPAEPREDRRRILLILLYRCGLRIGEACGLLVGDVERSRQPRLCIWKNRLGGVKTDNAERTLPLATLVTEAELAEVRAYVQRRYQQAGADAPLFPSFRDPAKAIDADKASQPIGQLLRRVTGDPAVTTHHLRHAAANWLYLMLMRAVLPDHIRDLPACLRHPDLDLGRCRAVRQALLATSPGLEIEALIADLLGHGTMEVALKSYLHVLPLLQCLLRLTPADHQALLAGRLGVSQRRVRQMLNNEGGLPGIYRRLHRTNRPGWAEAAA